MWDIIGGFEEQNMDKLKGVRLNVRVSNYNVRNKNRPSTGKNTTVSQETLIVNTEVYILICVMFKTW